MKRLFVNFMTFAAMATALIGKNRTAPYGKPWKNITSVNHATPLISTCWKTKKKVNTGQRIKKVTLF